MRNTVSILALILATACVSTDDSSEPIAPVVSSISEADKETANEPASNSANSIQRTKSAINENVELKNETEKLNLFFQEQFDARVQRSPMFQTSLGVKTNYDRWDDTSEAFALANFKQDQAAIGLMEKLVDYEKLTPDGQLSYRLFKLRGEQQAEMFQYRHHGYIFDQMYGKQSSIPAFLINQHRISNYEDAEAYIARLIGIETYLGSLIEQAKLNAENGIRPPKFIYEYVQSDIKNVLTGAPFGEGEDSPIFSDFKNKVNALEISGDEKLNLITEANAALLTAVLPTYQSLADWLNEDIKNADENDGAWKLPNGADYYKKRLELMTTTELTANEIHDLGLSEVERIHGEMKTIMKQVGFEGDLSEFFTFMRFDKQFYYDDTEAGRNRYLEEATEIIDTMKEELPSAFNTFPKAELIVKRVEPFREKSAGKAFYQRPAADGSRPGTYYANLYKMSSMPTYQMEALAYHEGLPGHHMQLAIAQELENVPKFRKYGRYTAYTEGWGLYTEYLPKEMGFYQDPYSDFGRLAMELWRAARLVVDTGLHEKKWTREKATQYLVKNTPNPEADCIKAIDRYIVMPGQATAYKIGMLKILELREQAKTQLGQKFDLASFHDVVLANGPIPLNELEHAVKMWVEKQ